VLGAGAACLAALLVAVLAVVVLQGQVVTDDEYVYLFQARALLTGHAALPAPPLPQFAQNAFVVVRDGRWIGQYPPGHPLLLAPAVLLGVPRLLPVLLAGGNLLLLIAILRPLVGPRWALLGGLLLLGSPLYLLTGATLLSHTTTLFALELAVWGALAVNRGGGVVAGSAAGLGLGLALLARPWTAVTLGAFPALLLLRGVLRRRAWRAAAAALGFAVACGLFLLAYNRGVSGSPWVTGYQALRNRSGYGEFGFGTIVPGVLTHTFVQGLLNAVILAVRFLVHSWGWPLAWIPLLYAWMARRTESESSPAGNLPLRTVVAGAMLMLGVGFLSYVPYWSVGVDDTGPVKTYELLLPASVLGVIGLREACRRKGRLAVVGFVLASWVVAAGIFWPPRIRHVHEVTSRVAEPLRLVEKNVRTPALVFVTGMQRPPAGSWVYGFPNPHPDLSDPILYVKDLEREDLDLLPYYPKRHAYRLVVGDEGFRLVPIPRDAGRGRDQ